MGEQALTLIKHNLDDTHLAIFGGRLTEWLIADLNRDGEDAPAFTESRAKALLRATGFVDDPTLHDFARLVENGSAVRIALYDLLDSSGLADNDEIQALAATTGAANAISKPQAPISWLSLTIAAHAWKSEYPLYQLDPATPPGEHSPAGQLVRRAAAFIRQQVQRSATERDKLGRKLAYEGGTAVSHSPSLEQLPDQPDMAPVPPHYRSPVPVSYPEYARETVTVAGDEPAPAPQPPSVTRTPPLTITAEDIDPPEPPPVRMPPLQITHDQIPPAAPPQSRVVTPNSTTGSGSNFNTAVQRRFGGKEPMRSVKLRIVVQEYHEGAGLYGLQVRVSCQGIKAHVAGTTNRDGVFLCELPVRVKSGLTYDVDVTWPRDHGAETERKSITLNVDRTEFTLPFFYRMAPKT
ncbi:MAG: hypothetical protein GY796_35030 [Chloroflexi bacterium]|nr:hypothetical protein [Chloroflexota bacterium]